MTAMVRSADAVARHNRTAREQVRELKTAGVDAINAVLESARPGMLFGRMDLAMYRAVIEESHFQRLPSSVNTGGTRDVEAKNPLQ